MAAHSTEPAHKKESKADYVYSLHGIRTNAFWQTQLEQQIEKSTGFEAGARNYMRFSTVMFVLKIIFAAKPLRLVEEIFSIFRSATA